MEFHFGYKRNLEKKKQGVQIQDPTGPIKEMIGEEAATAAVEATASVEPTLSHPKAPIHNDGPLTRARQSPKNLASSASAAVAGTGFKLKEMVALTASEAVTTIALKEEISKLKAVIEAEFKGIRSRGSNPPIFSPSENIFQSNNQSEI